MKAELLVARFRTFLLLIAGASCLLAIVELWFEEHTASAVQLLPFIFCALGAAAIAAVLIRPHRATIMSLRYTMGVTLFVSLFGIYEHFEHNLDFAREIRPNASSAVILNDTLYGANPLLAPGVLAMAAVLAVAATYYHPLLQSSDTAS